jgi:DNA-binding transcriptional regulator YhcF (GntR family)
MKKAKIFDFIQVDEFSSTPKYQQLANSILTGIQKNLFKKGDIMPSINEISFEFDISRMTVEKGYNYLKSIGVLDSVPGKGYFIKSVEHQQNLKIFMLFNKLSAHKKIIYDSFVTALGDKAAIDFYIYNNDFNLFRKLITNRKEDFTHIVIIPHFTENEYLAYDLIDTLPKEKLILMDKMIPRIKGEFGAVYENFEKDIYDALTQAIVPLQKYKSIKLIFPEVTYHSKEIIVGFTHFCADNAFEYEIIHSLLNVTIQKETAYINLMEDDLVILIDKILEQKLVLGKEVGVISYNETPLKRFLLNGLTTISTDFVAMGSTVANLILSNLKSQIEIPFTLTLRNSI